ncbi:TLC domain-containing protein, partial [Haematococcus lacustris]
ESLVRLKAESIPGLVTYAPGLADPSGYLSSKGWGLLAALCVYFAYELLYKSNFFWQDGPVPMILRTSPSTYLALGVSFGYFVIDFWTCVKYNLGGTEMVLHHLGSLLSVTTALV